jgi:hypothetical protein
MKVFFHFLLRSARLAALGLALVATDVCGQRPTATKATPVHSSPTEKFKLSAGPCVPKGYWVTIQGGSFEGPGKPGFPVPAGHTLRGSWGASGTAWAVGDELQPVPAHLSLLWFSYAENKFYEGDFALPQAKIQDLLNAGYWDLEKKKPGTYDEFTVCVLPKGAVVVWLTGNNQVLIGRFQGHETAANFHQYYGQADRATMVQEIREEMPPEVQAQIKAGTISPKQWDAYLTTYAWRVAFNVPFTIAQYSLHGVNAERFSDPLTRDLAPYRQMLLTATSKPVPRKLYVHGQAVHGAHYEVRVKAFDEAETMAAYKALHTASPQSPITLLFTVDKPFQKATMSLQNEAKQIPLTKSMVEVFSED